MYRYPQSSMFPASSSAFPYYVSHPWHMQQAFPYYQGHAYHPMWQQPSFSPYSTPYPKPHSPIKPQAPGWQSIMSQFKTKDGTFDINKMMNTMGQMVNAVNQVGSMVKGLSQTFKI
ncbi:YppG-like protein [Anoxybacillus vitaminiphilus]|jgi:hypothetical protein|uniref:YppG-like protein n=1 Tax=Paranoxybacillus vitaminiphilus TaxID=581036 RepID=A0A327YLZ3_9BACL|nr:YppG family protein [Anoxybacillus vitaminiphilus]RAK22104.1 YppG-like protein [Anoxybacillus vitaminiphilus]